MIDECLYFSLSVQLAGLSKLLALEYTPPIKNLAVLPLHLSPDSDEHLVQITEGRLPTFAAEIVPDYLRTKPDPAAENRMNLHEAKANAITNDAASKQEAQYKKIVTHIGELITKMKEEWEMESLHRNLRTETCSQNDTQILVKAVGMGIGLKTNSPMLMQQPGGMARVPGPVQMAASSPAGMQMGKMPSSIKTNIKSANLHPYR
jgi:mediator of RNA polymerase II transcription subunit 8